MHEQAPKVVVDINVNGASYQREIEPRLLLVEFIREELGLTGTHIGCDTSYCGACTIILEGNVVKSCTLLAVQADGRKVETVEGLESGGELHPLQTAFSEHHGLQCGYCTPGMLMSAKSLLDNNPQPTEEQIRKGISGNTCRCTGYVNIVKAIDAAAVQMWEG
ncbi:MAG: (2Fe-2S)-binding protein [Halioglobus sp.]